MAGKPINSVFLVAGDDNYRKEKTTNSIVNSVFGKEDRSLDFETIYCDDKGDKELYGILRTPPFLSMKKVVLLKNVERLKDGKKKELIEYVKSPVDSTCLVIVTTDEFTKKDTKTKYYQELSGAARVFELFSLYENQAKSWARERLSELGKSADEDSINILVEETGSNLQELNSEIEKIAAFLGKEKKIGAEDTASLVKGFNAKDIYDLTNALGNRDTAGSILTFLSIVKNDPKSGIYILAVIYGHFKKLWNANLLLKRGVSQEDIGRKLGVHSYFLNGFMKQARNFGIQSFKKVFYETAKADINIKTGRLPQDIVLETLIFSICAA